MINIFQLEKSCVGEHYSPWEKNWMNKNDEQVNEFF